MSLRKKTLLIIGVTLVGLFVLLYASSRSILLESFVLLENDEVYQNTERGMQAIAEDIARLNVIASDWAARSRSAAFIQAADPDYVALYLEDSTFTINRLNLVVFAAPDGQIVYEQRFDLHNNRRVNTSTGIGPHLQAGQGLANTDATGAHGGLLMLPSGPALVASVPIRDGADGPVGGWLVLGRFLDQDEVRRLADATKLLLSVYFYQEPVLPANVAAARTQLSERKRFTILNAGSRQITGYSLLNDLYGNPALILENRQSRHIYEEGQASMWYFVLALLGSGLVFSVMILLLLEQTVLSRLAKLSRGVNQIHKRHDLSLRMPVNGSDELAQLGHAVNNMLTALEQSEAAERQQRLFAESLRRTAEKLAASIQIEDTLRLIIEQLKQIVPYDRALIVLVHDNDTLRVADTSAFAGHEQLAGRIFHEPEVPVLAEGMQTKRPILIPAVQPETSPLALPGFETFAGTWVSVPLRTHATPIGLLCVAHDDPAAYSPPQLEAMSAFAQQAALAVENAQILTQLETSLFELRETQTRLARSARLSAAGEIAAGVAHQINNPLTAVIAEVHLLDQALGPADPGRESVDAIRQAAERAGSVVQRMLDLTRVHDYVTQSLNVNESLQSSISLLRPQLEPHRVRLEALLTARLPMVNASRQHLEDVWLNLLLNARDAVSQNERGIIKVTSRFDAAVNGIRVTVEDNGPGIPPDRLKSIFEPFFTTKNYGTGLGLSICRDVIIRHGGVIEVESVEGHGTIFSVSLPAGQGVT